MNTIKTEIIDKGMNKIITNNNNLSGTVISIGLIGEVAEYAFCNEYGTKDIPSRPFMRKSFDDGINNLVDFNKKYYGYLIDNKISKDIMLKSVGEFHKNQIKTKILHGDFKKNSPLTVKKKKSSRPLIDTSTMINSLDYKVITKR